MNIETNERYPELLTRLREAEKVVIRWPFEKIVYVNQKSYLLRVHKTLSQLPGEVGERAGRVAMDSVDWVSGLAAEAAVR